MKIRNNLTPSPCRESGTHKNLDLQMAAVQWNNSTWDDMQPKILRQKNQKLKIRTDF